MAVVQSDAPNILCIAGAGSGKTTTLCERIARLIKDGRAAPREMVIITFTNAAALEMKKRLGHDIKFGFIGTLHSFLMRLLSKQGHLVNLPNTLSIIDDDSKKALLENIIEEMKLKVVLKNVLPLLKRSDLILNSKGMTRTKEEIVTIEYHHRLQASGLLDFDTILFFGERLIRALDSWSYKFLFVDEYQDSADEDARIYQAMPCKHKFFVGDPDQAIYGFRGGNVKNILDIANEKPESSMESYGSPPSELTWKVFTLEMNYRCAHVICGAANRLIQNNLIRFHKSTIANREGGTVRVVRASAPAQETVLNSIQSLNAEDCAVLCRTNRLAADFANHLAAHGIPVAKKKFVENPIDWNLAKLFLTVLANPWNDLSAFAFLVERHGKEKAAQIKYGAAMKMQSINEYHLKLEGNVFEVTSLAAHGISTESRERIHDAARQLSGLGEWTISDLLFFLNSGELHREEIGTGVTVTTMHSAKGREWKNVFVIGCEQGVVPSGKKGTDIEEERRLFYVAITRAMDNLVISHCEARPAPFGPQIMRPAERSQFVGEMGC